MSTRSVRRQIVVGFATLILVFGGAAGYSLLRQQQAVEVMRLANEAYLRLNIDLGEVRVNQGLLNTLLDRLLDERDRASSRTWISLARRSRRARLDAARARAIASVADARSPDDARILHATVRTLDRVERIWAEDEPRFDALFLALTSGDDARALPLKEDLLAREGNGEDLLAGLMRELQARTRGLSDRAERQQEQSLRLTLLAAALSVVLGVLTTLRARQALRPLVQLRDRARAVARGELTPVAVDAAPDEIGELAKEFERMVDAVSARDAALRKANAERLQAERLAAIGRMAAHVTHEVRNPLSSMALNAEMLADEMASMGDAGRESARLVGAIQREIDRLTGITEEYLRVARLPKPRLEREDMRVVVDEAVAFVAKEMDAAGVALTLIADDELPSVAIDEAQIRQVLLNLLRNAREAMDAARSGTRRLVVRVQRAPGGVEVSVADSGPGLTDEAQEHLFELFFTTKERGTGLGLPLTREVIAAHGGTLRAERASPEDGGGARFVVWVPTLREDPTP